MLQLHHSQQQGRFITAKQPVETQTEVLHAASYAHIVLASHRKVTCAACLGAINRPAPPVPVALDGTSIEGAQHIQVDNESAGNPSIEPPIAPSAHLNVKSEAERCVECDQVYYCSHACKQTHAETHALLCRQMRRLATAKLGLHEKSVLQLVLCVLVQRQKERSQMVRNDAAGVVEHEASLDTCIQSALDDPLNPCEAQYRHVTALESHYADWTDETKKEWRKAVSLLESLAMEAHLLDDTLISDSHGDTHELVLMHLISKIESNGFGIWARRKRRKARKSDSLPGQTQSLTINELGANKENPIEVAGPDHVSDDDDGFQGVDETGVCVGRAVYPFASYFNYGRLLVFQTIKPLALNEQVTISYMNTNAPLSSRRSALLQDYYFECRCTRCESESKLKPGARDKISFTKSAQAKGKGKPGNKKKR
ncbi:hypothetical protein HDU78_010416 [Chytriomyces hyalinus]|nr:hypothetical protein HDU78_010416 [Chytriomyces hyalinus]